MSNRDSLRSTIEGAIRAAQSLTVFLQAVAAALDQNSTEYTAAPDPGKHAPDRTITAEQIRQVMRNKQGDGKINQVRELFLKYGAGRLSEVRVEDYASLLRELEAL